MQLVLVYSEARPQLGWSKAAVHAPCFIAQDGKTPIDVGKLMAMAEDSQQPEQSAKAA